MRRILAGLLCLMALLSSPAATIAHADTIGVKSAELLPEDEDYVLNAQFDLAFNPTLEEALQKVQALRWNPAKLRAHAEQFSEDVFIARFRSVLMTALEQKKLGRLGADDAA